MAESENKSSIDEINNVSLDTIEELKNENENSNIGFAIISMIGIGSVIIPFESPVWILKLIVAAAVCGFFLLANNRIMSAIRAIIFFITIQIVFMTYTKTQDSIHNIELILILLVSWIPSIIFHSVTQNMITKKIGTKYSTL